ncbi:MAG TPA: hypothetical protein VIM82_00375, partial [Sulfurimonas sp.]
MDDVKRKKILQRAVKSNYTDLPCSVPYSYVPIDHRLIHVGDKIEFNIFINDYLTHMSLFLQSDTVVDDD